MESYDLESENLQAIIILNAANKIIRARAGFLLPTLGFLLQNLDKFLYQLPKKFAIKFWT